MAPKKIKTWRWMKLCTIKENNKCNHGSMDESHNDLIIKDDTSKKRTAVAVLPQDYAAVKENTPNRRNEEVLTAVTMKNPYNGEHLLQSTFKAVSPREGRQRNRTKVTVVLLERRLAIRMRRTSVISVINNNNIRIHFHIFSILDKLGNEQKPLLLPWPPLQKTNR